jgi:mRNA-degrading endonuclease RelE of RelBE toxin-antitoxin system
LTGNCICKYIAVSAYLSRDVELDLRKLKAYDRRRVIDAMEAQLVDRPTTPTRQRKLLASLIPPWTAEPPIWELRVGDHRVFYDVAEEERVVYVRAIRRKPPGKATEEIL